MRLNILHAIHDFLPRHRAGSEIYAAELCRALLDRHHVTVLTADYDPSRRHADVTWRLHDGLPVAEVVNNWVGSDFESTYRSGRVGARLGQVLDAVQPQILHVHNLLNLSFDLPGMAKLRGIPVVATLHDYTLVCPSGGQRVHQAERHVCRDIDPSRCARCFPDSPFHTRMMLGRWSGTVPGSRPIHRAARWIARRWPLAAHRGGHLAWRATRGLVSEDDVVRRLDAARRVFDQVDLFVAPVAATAREYERLGVPPGKIRVSDYGTSPIERPAPARASGRLCVGYVGTLAWHKGVHVLIDAFRDLDPDAFTLEIHGDPAVFPEYVASLREASSGLPVTWCDPFARDRVAEIMGRLDVLVVPSVWLENSPLVIHEARLAGVAVVASRIGGIPDLIEDGRTGLLFEAGSPDALSVVLRRLAADRALLGSLTDPASSPAIKTMTDDAREWEAVYRGLVGEPAS